MQGQLDGIFQMQSLLTQGGRRGRLILVAIVVLYSIPIAVSNRETWGWLGTAICSLVDLALLSYGYLVLRRRPSIRLWGIGKEGNRLLNGIVNVETPDLKMISERQSRGGAMSSELRPVGWQAVHKEVTDADAGAVTFTLTISDKEHFQLMAAPWHLSVVEIVSKQGGGVLIKQLLTPGKLCLVSGNRADFDFSRNDSALLNQLDRVGEWLERHGYQGPGAACVKIVPSQTDKSFAVMFGAIGMGIAAIMDEKKKRKFREDLEAGKFSLIDKESDRKLLDLIDRWQWAITTQT